MRSTSVVVNVDIDIDDFLYELSNRDREYMMRCLQEEGYISDLCIIKDDGTVEPKSMKKCPSPNDEFEVALSKLSGNGWKLTKEEEEDILKISQRIS